MNLISIVKAHTIKSKVILMFASVIILVVAVLLIFTGINRRNNSLTQAKSIAFERANTFASIFKREFDEPMNMAIDMVEAVHTVKEHTPDAHQRRDLIISYLKNILDDEVFYSTVFTIWEPNSLGGSDSAFSDVEGHNFTGRFVPNIIKDAKGTITIAPMENFDIQGEGDFYLKPKKTSKPFVTDPIKLEYEGREAVSIVFSAPILSQGTFLAVTGLSIPINKIQLWVEQQMPEDIRVTLIGNDGQIIADNKIAELSGKSLKTITNDWRDIMKSKNDEEIYSKFDEEKLELEIFVPFRIANTANVWGAKIIVDLRQTIDDSNAETIYTAMIGLLLLLISVASVSLSVRYLLQPLNSIANIAEHVASGDMQTDVDQVHVTGSEVGRINQALGSIVTGLDSMADFALQIGKGNLDVEYRPLSKNDVLGNSLLQMQESLIIAKDEREKRRREDKKRTWATYGLATFSDILRKHSDDITKLSSLIISTLVDYLKANQGGLFIYNDENMNDKHMELVASYAYNRQKNAEKKIPLRVGLVGMCAVEKKTKYITDIPDAYINITSGLGDATPRSLLLVPLVLNEEIFGVLELASFLPYEKSEIEFVEQLAENIASTLSSVKTSQRTAELLEQSQKQSEEMTTQEEEMRQNLEELLETQGEMARKIGEQDETIQNYLSSQSQLEISQKKLIERERFIQQIVVSAPTGIISTSSSGEIMDVNNYVCQITGYDMEALMKKNITLLMHELDIVTIRDEDSFEMDVFGTNDIHFVAHCHVSVFRQEDKVKYLFFVRDITEDVQVRKSTTKQLNSLQQERNEYRKQSEELISEYQILAAKLEESENAVQLEMRRQESLREELDLRNQEYERLKDELNKLSNK